MVRSMKREDVKTAKDVVRFLSEHARKTEFEKKVLVATFRIPTGKVSTYKRIAEKAGYPRAYRAVANALHRNPLAPIVPCHRVVRSDGKFGGEGKDAESRRKLVGQEGVPLKNDSVKINEKILY
jgi:O-6-methylguanine DNA methyltransferase